MSRFCDALVLAKRGREPPARPLASSFTPSQMLAIDLGRRAAGRRLLRLSPGLAQVAVEQDRLPLFGVWMAVRNQAIMAAKKEPLVPKHFFLRKGPSLYAEGLCGGKNVPQPARHVAAKVVLFSPPPTFGDDNTVATKQESTPCDPDSDELSESSP